MFSHQFERDYRVEPYQITANKRGLAKLSRDLAEILRLADIANRYDKPISHATCEVIRAAVTKLPAEVSPEAADVSFRCYRSRPGWANCCTICTAWACWKRSSRRLPTPAACCNSTSITSTRWTNTRFAPWPRPRDSSKDSGPLGSVYKHLKRKWLLHLALLIHDLGKGYAEDHSDVGRRIAEETAARLRLSQRDAETLMFLVHKHLIMSHLAFRRDTSDNQLIVRFAVEVGSPEVLEMLFVMTAADLAAVGPGVLNAWKIEVLADLFHRTIRHLGADDPTLDLQTRLNARRNDVLALLHGDDDEEWFERQLAALPDHYLQTTQPDQIVTRFAATTRHRTRSGRGRRPVPAGNTDRRVPDWH